MNPITISIVKGTRTYLQKEILKTAVMEAIGKALQKQMLVDVLLKEYGKDKFTVPDSGSLNYCVITVPHKLATTNKKRRALFYKIVKALKTIGIKENDMYIAIEV
jgi:hypothetical protein